MTMADISGEFPTIIGSDARFKGELSFEKGVRIEGTFDGQIKSKGSLHVAEGAKVQADVEAASMDVEGECKGNILISEKLHLLATAKMEGDIRTNRLEIADGAIFVGNVAVGQSATEAPARRPAMGTSGTVTPTPQSREPGGKPTQTQSTDGSQSRPRTQEMRVPANP